ncbi:MAG: hypothetical protein IT389_06500 [Nitrospira sp.]|nr:hypothetical protein [Nitrospira sp.]
MRLQSLAKPVRYNAVTPEQYRGFGFPALLTFGAWLAQNKTRIPLT